jgi:MFS family permease
MRRAAARLLRSVEMADVKGNSFGAPILLGMLFGAVNVVVIALAMAVMVHDSAALIFVVMFGGVPGIVVGGLLGVVARLLATHSPRWRVVLLALPAFGLVAFLGATFGFLAIVPLACIPTTVAALILERSTRQTPTPPIPVATADRLPAAPVAPDQRAG